jgi:hypothetical protein
MSEPLWEEQGTDQVAEEEHAHDQTDEVFSAHSRSTPFTTRRATRKKKAPRTR